MHECVNNAVVQGARPNEAEAHEMWLAWLETKPRPELDFYEWCARSFLWPEAHDLGRLGALSSTAEQAAHNRLAGGSSPSGPTNLQAILAEKVRGLEEDEAKILEVYVDHLIATRGVRRRRMGLDLTSLGEPTYVGGGENES